MKRVKHKYKNKAFDRRRPFAARARRTHTRSKPILRRALQDIEKGGKEVLVDAGALAASGPLAAYTGIPPWVSVPVVRELELDAWDRAFHARYPDHPRFKPSETGRPKPPMSSRPTKRGKYKSMMSASAGRGTKRAAIFTNMREQKHARHMNLKAHSDKDHFDRALASEMMKRIHDASRFHSAPGHPKLWHEVVKEVMRETGKNAWSAAQQVAAQREKYPQWQETLHHLDEVQDIALDQKQHFKDLTPAEKRGVTKYHVLVYKDYRKKIFLTR